MSTLFPDISDEEVREDYAATMLEVVTYLKLGSIDATTAHIIPLDAGRVLNIENEITKRVELLNVLETVLKSRGLPINDPEYITPLLPALQARGFRVREVASMFKDYIFEFWHDGDPMRAFVCRGYEVHADGSTLLLFDRIERDNVKGVYVANPCGLGLAVPFIPATDGTGFGGPVRLKTIVFPEMKMAYARVNDIAPESVKMLAIRDGYEMYSV